MIDAHAHHHEGLAAAGASQHDATGGHTGHAGHTDHAAEFRRAFRISLVLTIPAVGFSEMVQEWLHVGPLDLPGIRWITPLLATAAFAVGGPIFLRGAAQELRTRRPGMMTLVSMGLLVAFAASVATEFGAIEVDLWFELATLVTIMLLGHWIEMRAIGRARGALAALAALLPEEAERIGADGVTTRVPVGALAVGDLVLVRAGGRVPADGLVVDGAAEFDESMVTGESRPVAKRIGDAIVAGTVSTDSSVHIRVSRVGDDTALAGIQRLVVEAQQSQSRAQALADRFAAMLVYVAVLAGAATFIVWTLLGQGDHAVERTVTVLVIACPHALGLAIPLTIAVSTGLAARAGILVKDRLALERMRTIDAVLFDKTGTLTYGRPAVGDVATHGVSQDRLLSYAASVEADSEHPLARAIVQHAQEAGVRAERVTTRTLSGRGIEAVIDGSVVAVGGPALLRARGLVEPAGLRDRTDTWRSRGATVVHVLRDTEIIGAFALEDTVRPESRAAIEGLRARGIRSVLITGDAAQVADAVARDVGIDEVFSEVLPQDKERAVIELQQRGMRVAMVGDGVNDAPALARADVGLAIGAGTDVAIESADVVLASSDPRGVLAVVRLSQASYRKMVQNLMWGAGYNVVAIPLAAGVLAFAGVTLSPAIGAVLMSVSTIVVALNAQLLRRVALRTD